VEIDCCETETVLVEVRVRQIQEFRMSNVKSLTVGILHGHIVNGELEPGSHGQTCVNTTSSSSERIESRFCVDTAKHELSSEKLSA